jgi:dTDP-4-amino-4,6-dideoxygalactose transaminase
MPEPVPAFSLARQAETVGPAVQAAVARVLASGRYAQGPECEAFEREIAARFQGAPAPVGALTCASGTDALHLALRALGVGPGDVVMTTAFSFFATAGAILLAGARPEFVDIDPASFNLDPKALERALARPLDRGHEGRIAAILPVHLYGEMAGMPAILALAAARGIPVIEDAAQAIGAERDGRSAGAWGAIGCFSFYPTKNLGAMGEGGLVTSSDPALLERLKLLRVHGSRKRYEHEILGWNARMHELQAAILRAKLPYLEGWNRRRREIAELYHARLRKLAQVALPELTPGRVFHQFVVRVPRRDAVRQFLLERGVATEVYYPLPLHRQPALRDYAPLGPLPETERAAAEALALPMFPELTDAEAERVAAALAAFFRRPAGARA